MLCTLVLAEPDGHSSQCSLGAWNIGQGPSPFCPIMLLDSTESSSFEETKRIIAQ